MSTTEFIPVHDVYDGKFNAVSGKQIDLLCPTPDMICIEDIAHALSNICRFGGHSRLFYSVAQHSVLVAELGPIRLRKEALLHDATEAYVGDVIKPLKVLLGDVFENIENSFLKAIIKKFGLDDKRLLKVKQYDKEALELEHEYLQKGNFDELARKIIEYPGNIERLLVPWPPEISKRIFLSFYEGFNIPG
jgi:hypothetical protein